MSSFAPLHNVNSQIHRAQIAGAANAALRGETHNAGILDVPAGVTVMRLIDERMGAGRCVLLSALDSTAAELRWWTDPESISKGGVDINFLHAPFRDCRFAYLVAGVMKINREGV